ncbi:MAG TPA: aldehyde dehydrogenase family protein, partial [Bacillota bacterium]|nr:aldehyde dehydrogenase family protein [Bacillota bacterium]
MKVLKQFIDGEWIVSTTNETRKIINPFNQEVIAEVTEGNDTDAKKAIKAAREAFDEGEWATTSAVERGKLVRNIATLIERDKEELARLESLDTGKTVDESRDDMDGIADVFHYYADLAGK